MLPLPPFELLRPTSLDAALALLRRHAGSAVLLAGGTDLLPNMKHGLVEPRQLISLAGIRELRGVRTVDGAAWIGAMTPLHTVATHPLLLTHARGLAEAAAAVGGPHHRRMGTLGGNLCLDTRCRYYNQTYFWRAALGYCLKKDGTVCHVVSGGRRCVATASNDTGAPAIALASELLIAGPAGVRVVPAREFYTADGLANTVLEPGEVVTALRVPLVEGRRSAYEKLRPRGAIDFPQLSVAVRVDVKGGLVEAIDVVVSALAARPRALKESSLAVALARPLSELPVEALAEAARRECTPLPTLDADVSWRRAMVPVLVRRALERARANVG